MNSKFFKFIVAIVVLAIIGLVSVASLIWKVIAFKFLIGM